MTTRGCTGNCCTVLVYRVTNDFGEDRFLNVEIYLKNRSLIIYPDSCCKTIRTADYRQEWKFKRNPCAPFFPSIISRGRHSRGEFLLDLVFFPPRRTGFLDWFSQRKRSRTRRNDGNPGTPKSAEFLWLEPVHRSHCPSPRDVGFSSSLNSRYHCLSVPSNYRRSTDPPPPIFLPS